MSVSIIHRALLDAVGTCVAQGVFPLIPIPSFAVNETDTGYKTDFAIVMEDVFGINRDDIARSICEHIVHCCEIDIARTEIKDGLIMLDIK